MSIFNATAPSGGGGGYKSAHSTTITTGNPDTISFTVDSQPSEWVMCIDTAGPSTSTWNTSPVVFINSSGTLIYAYGRSGNYTTLNFRLKSSPGVTTSYSGTTFTISVPNKSGYLYNGYTLFYK